jgi:hypothetical protein
MKVLKWFNLIVVMALIALATISLTITSNEECLTIYDLVTILSPLLYCIAFAAMSILYKNNLLPDFFERIMYKITSED